MDRIEQELAYEEKIDDITEHLEQLVLDAMVSVLRKIIDRNKLFDQLEDRAKNKDRSDEPF